MKFKLTYEYRGSEESKYSSIHTEGNSLEVSTQSKNDFKYKECLDRDETFIIKNEDEVDYLI